MTMPRILGEQKCALRHRDGRVVCHHHPGHTGTCFGHHHGHEWREESSLSSWRCRDEQEAISRFNTAAHSAAEHVGSEPALQAGMREHRVQPESRFCRQQR